MHDGDGDFHPRFCLISYRLSRTSVDCAIQERQLDIGRRVPHLRWRYGLSQLGHDERAGLAEIGDLHAHFPITCPSIGPSRQI